MLKHYDNSMEIRPNPVLITNKDLLILKMAIITIQIQIIK